MPRPRQKRKKKRTLPHFVRVREDDCRATVVLDIPNIDAESLIVEYTPLSITVSFDAPQANVAAETLEMVARCLRLVLPMSIDDEASQHSVSPVNLVLKLVKKQESVWDSDGGEAGIKFEEPPIDHEEAMDGERATADPELPAAPDTEPESGAVSSDSAAASSMDASARSIVEQSEQTEGPVESAMEAEPVGFIAAADFAGHKPGYVFKNGENGVGYYVDGSPDGLGSAALRKGFLEKKKRAAATASGMMTEAVAATELKSVREERIDAAAETLPPDIKSRLKAPVGKLPLFNSLMFELD